jgi:hypothetical protein
MEETLAAMESLSEGEQFTYQEIADRYGLRSAHLHCPEETKVSSA